MVTASIMQNLLSCPFVLGSGCKHHLYGSHCALPPMDGQAELAWVARLNWVPRPTNGWCTDLYFTYIVQNNIGLLSSPKEGCYVFSLGIGMYSANAFMLRWPVLCSCHESELKALYACMHWTACHLDTWLTIATCSAMTFADYVQLFPSRVRYQGQGLGSVIDRSQSLAHESGTVCLLRCQRLKTMNSSKSC